MAVSPVASQAKVPFVDTNAAAIPVTRSPYAIRTSFTLTQQAYPLAKWAAKHGYKTAYTAVSDYAPGQEGRDAFIKGFTEAGGKIVGQVTFPPPPNVVDFAPFLLRIKDTHPDVVYIVRARRSDRDAADEGVGRCRFSGGEDSFHFDRGFGSRRGTEEHGRSRGRVW